VVSGDQALCGIEGHWNCCDVYLDIDQGWLGSTVTLFAQIDGMQVPIDRKLLSESDYSVDGNGNVVALVFSVRGHPCSGWAVMIDQAVNLVNVPAGGIVRMFGWGKDTAAESPRLCPRRYSLDRTGSSGVISALPIKLLQFCGVNGTAQLGGVVGYIQLFDAAAVPIDGTAPTLAPLPVGLNQAWSYTFNDGGWRFEVGCCWAFSSTLATKTLAGSVFPSALYRGP
jgi:hypothetical protein